MDRGRAWRASARRRRGTFARAARPQPAARCVAGAHALCAPDDRRRERPPIFSTTPPPRGAQAARARCGMSGAREASRTGSAVARPRGGSPPCTASCRAA
eukprot:6634373-Prymnesium_polylepis.2